MLQSVLSLIDDDVILIAQRSKVFVLDLHNLSKDGDIII